MDVDIGSQVVITEFEICFLHTTNPDMAHDCVVIDSDDAWKRALDDVFLDITKPDMAHDYVVIDLDDVGKRSLDDDWQVIDAKDDESAKDCVQVDIFRPTLQDSQLPPDPAYVKKQLSSHTLQMIEQMHLSPESCNLCLELI